MASRWLLRTLRTAEPYHESSRLTLNNMDLKSGLESNVDNRRNEVEFAVERIISEELPSAVDKLSGCDSWKTNCYAELMGASGIYNSWRTFSALWRG